jgi:hypothetical protein
MLFLQLCNNLLVIIQEAEIQHQPKVPTVCNPSRFWQMLKPQILCALEDPRILSMENLSRFLFSRFCLSKTCPSRRITEQTWWQCFIERECVDLDYNLEEWGYFVKWIGKRKGSSIIKTKLPLELGSLRTYHGLIWVAYAFWVFLISSILETYHSRHWFHLW